MAKYLVTLVRSPSCEYLQAEDPTGLLFEERVERAERLRLEGNEQYKSGNHQIAEGKYIAVGFWDGLRQIAVVGV